jgi:hypothetical protein
MTCTILPGFPGNSGCSTLRAHNLEPSEQHSLFLALSARNEGRDPASDALCRAPCERKYQDRIRSPPRQRRRASSAQSAWFATNSIHEHNPDDLRTWLTRHAQGG